MEKYAFFLETKNGPGTIKSFFVFVLKISKFKHFYYTEDQFCIFVSSPIIPGTMKPKVGPLFLMVCLWIGWYSIFICCFATLGLTKGNFHNTLINYPILTGRHSIHIFINQIVKEAWNHHEMASHLQTSCSCTKDAQNKQIVPASWNKVFFLLSDIHLSQT